MPPWKCSSSGLVPSFFPYGDREQFLNVNRDSWTSITALMVDQWIESNHGKAIQLSQATTDAWWTGWGARCQNCQIHAVWSEKERDIHINNFELLAVTKAFKTLKATDIGQSSTGGHWQQHHDVLHKQGRAHSMSLLFPMIQFWEWIVLCLIFSMAIHVAEEENWIANSLSYLKTTSGN